MILKCWSPNLLCVQVNEPQVVSNDPFKGSKVQGLLQASDCSNVSLLPEEAHPNVVPQLRRVGRLDGRNTILDKGHIVV